MLDPDLVLDRSHPGHRLGQVFRGGLWILSSDRTAELHGAFEAGHLPVARIVDLSVLGDKNAVFDVRNVISDSGQLRTVSLTGPFYTGATSPYDLTLDKYGDPVEIAKP